MVMCQQQNHRRHNEARMSVIDDEPIPDGGKRMVEFKVEKDMRTLKISMKKGDYPSGRMIKPFASVKEGEWIVNQ